MAIAHLQGGAVCVLDAVLEVRPPFDPDVAVAECSALLRRFGITRVMGDRYAGNWPVSRFAAHGINFEQSARPKNDLYHDFLPLANARRVELLDHPRIGAQFVGLERRVARSGRDSIDHTPGGHDDVANAVAGVLVGLDQDRRPALVRADDMLAEGAPVPLPPVCEAVVAVIAADQKGGCAVTYWSHSPHIGYPLTLLDFECGGLSGTLFADTAARLEELARTCRAQRGAALFVTPEPLARQAAARGMRVNLIPEPLIADPGRLMMAAAGHALAGAVKIAAPAHARAEASPLRGQLDLRGGDVVDTPLRLSLLAGVALALDDADQAVAA